MRICLNNLGALRQAEFELGELTVICGRNNTGKTYATYALYGFLSQWRNYIVVHVADKSMAELLTQGVTTIDINKYASQSQDILAEACKSYVTSLSQVFASDEKMFLGTKFKIELGEMDISTVESFERKVGSAKAQFFSISKAANSSMLTVTLLVERQKIQVSPNSIRQAISASIRDILFEHLFPSPFIASAERTGAAIFRKELNFARNRLLERVNEVKKEVDAYNILEEFFDDYALPVRVNVEFTRRLEEIGKRNSFIVEAAPELLDEFSEIIGGKYSISRKDELHFLPTGKRIKLTMDESSSAVRSLLDIGFYLRHVAKKGDLLIVDEPELNLHPENQRRVARLFSKLLKLGIKVFITTHSDYILKELSTLIMLGADKPHISKVREEYCYSSSEVLDARQVRAYVAEEASIRVDGGVNKVKCNTLVRSDVSQESGIDARSFDSTIVLMNDIQEAIAWGDE